MVEFVPLLSYNLKGNGLSNAGLFLVRHDRSRHAPHAAPSVSSARPSQVMLLMLSKETLREVSLVLFFEIVGG